MKCWPENELRSLGNESLERWQFSPVRISYTLLSSFSDLGTKVKHFIFDMAMRVSRIRLGQLYMECC